MKPGGLWPLNTGGRQRSFNTLAELSQRHEVVVVTTHGPGDDPAGLEAALSTHAKVLSIPYAAPKWGTAGFFVALAASWLSRHPIDIRKWRVAAVRRRIAELLNDGHYDLVVADFLVAVENLPRTVPVPVVLFEHNVEYLIWKRLCDIETRWWRRLPLAIEWRKMRRREGVACRRADLTIAVSERDRDELATLAPEARIVAVPTGVDTTYFRPVAAPEVPNRLVFSGSMDWYPNEDAMAFLVREILPIVRRDVPDVSISIVGRNPSPAVRALAETAGVLITGTVDDVRPFVAEAALYVVPLRAGGGTRLKIFEALAMGKAVLSTSIGAEGLEVEPGRHAVLADDARAFAAEIVALLRDPKRRLALGQAGRVLVEERYSWKSVAGTFIEHLLGAERRGREVRSPTQPMVVRA